MQNSSQDVLKKSLGREGERRAKKYLKQLGYKIVRTNWKTPFGEADIVARDGETIVFCEVKTRESDAFGTAAEAVNRAKQKRYIAMAKYFISRAKKEVNVRFDVAEVYDDRINYILSAFDCNLH